MRLKKPDEESKTYLFMLSSGGNIITFDTNGCFVLPSWPISGTNFYVGSLDTRKALNGKPIHLTIDLEVLQDNNVVCSDRVVLTVAPVILPPECNSAEKVYSTLITNVPGTVLLTCGAWQWMQDMVKFTKVQTCTDGTETVFVTLGHDFDGTLDGALRYAQGVPGLAWSVGGEGGNMMATPALGTNAPYGKLMVGTKHAASAPQWAAQGIQPITYITNNWLLVGHVDEILMWVATNKVLYADPWKAADLLHQEIAAGNQTNGLWFGFDADGTNRTIQQVVIATNAAGYKLTTLPSPGLSNSTSAVTLIFTNTIFVEGDILRVDEEILQVTTANGPTVTVARAQVDSTNRPAVMHGTGSYIYAYTGIMQSNLTIGVNSVAAQIRSATNQLQQALGSFIPSYVPMPVLFQYLTEEDTENLGHGYAAVSANVVNCLAGMSNNVYYSKSGCAVVRDYISSVLPGAQEIQSVWVSLHCNFGEVHCATATIRQLSATPPWWLQISNWE
jgi:hypothetical protein